MVLLALLGYISDSKIFIVAIIGLGTAALFTLYEQMTVATNDTISAGAKAFQFRLFVLLLALSVLGFVAAYFAFDNIEWSGFALGLAAICMQSLAGRHDR